MMAKDGNIEIGRPDVQWAPIRSENDHEQKIVRSRPYLESAAAQATRKRLLAHQVFVSTRRIRWLGRGTHHQLAGELMKKKREKSFQSLTGGRRAFYTLTTDQLTCRYFTGTGDLLRRADCVLSC